MRRHSAQALPILALLLCAGAIRPLAAQAQLPALTGTWDVTAHFCETQSAAPHAGCSLTGPNEVFIQALDANRLVIGLNNSTADFKCVLAQTADGKTQLGCAECGSNDLYQALEVDDGYSFINTMVGKVTSADKMKLKGQKVTATDANLASGVQPLTQVITTKWSAQRRDSVAPGLTDCSTP